MNLKIAVIGLGYVGLPLANALSKNFSVFGFDENIKRVITINSSPKTIRAANQIKSIPLLKKAINVPITIRGI